MEEQVHLPTLLSVSSASPCRHFTGDDLGLGGEVCCPHGADVTPRALGPHCSSLLPVLSITCEGISEDFRSRALFLGGYQERCVWPSIKV